MYPRRRYCSIPPSTELMSPTYGLFVFLLRAFPSHTIFQLSYAKYGSTYAPPDSVELEKEYNLWCNLDTPLFKQRRMQFFCPIWAKDHGTNFRPNYVSYVLNGWLRRRRLFERLKARNDVPVTFQLPTLINLNILFFSTRQPKRMGGGQYIITGKDSKQNSVVMFSLPERVGALAQALKVFEVRPSLSN